MTSKRAKRELQSQQNERDSKRNLIANAEKDAHQAEMKLVHKRQSYNEREALQKRIEEAKAEIAESQEKVKVSEELRKELMSSK